MSHKVNLANGINIHCYTGDIITPPIEADCLINPSNQFLWRHAPGGAESAIWKSAGEKNIIASLKTVKAVLPVSPGFIIVTNAFNLRRKGYRFIIHAVGPNKNIEEQADIQLLINTYSHAFRAARQHLRSRGDITINTVGISSGMFGFSKEETISALIDAAKAMPDHSDIKQINLIDNNSREGDQSTVEIFDKVVHSKTIHES